MDSKLLVACGVLGVIVVAYFLNSKEKRNKALNPQQKIALKLIKKEKLTHDIRRFRFALPHPADVLGLPNGKHIFVSTQKEGKLVSRPYTPVSSDDDVGFVEFVIKVYPPAPPQFPVGGVLSQHLDELQLGDTMDFRGPIGKIEYKGRGKFAVHSSGGIVEKTVKHVGLIAGGTGITPCLQIIRAIMKDPSDTTKVSLIFANKTEQDIFLREELEDCAERHPHFKLHYTLDYPPEECAFSKGFIDQQMIQDHMPVDHPDDSLVLCCGPPPMINYACKPNLEKCNYPEDRVLCF